MVDHYYFRFLTDLNVVADGDDLLSVEEGGACRLPQIPPNDTVEQEGKSLGWQALPITQGLDHKGVSRGNQFVVVEEPRRQAQEGLVRPRVHIQGLKLELLVPNCICCHGFLTDTCEILFL